MPSPLDTLIAELRSADSTADLGDLLARTPGAEPIVRLLHTAPEVQELVDVLLTPSSDRATQVARLLDVLATANPALAKALEGLGDGQAETLLHLLINRGGERGGRRLRLAGREKRIGRALIGLVERYLGERGRVAHRKLLSGG